MVRLGMVGLGAIAPYYSAALERMKSAHLAAVCDTRPERMATYRAPGVHEFTSYADLLLSESIDAVVLNVPNDRHFDFARMAFLAGKHVCCEKPLCFQVADAEAIYALASQQHRTMFTAFHRRYNRNLLRLHSQLPQADQIAGVTANYLERIQEHIGTESWYLDPLHCGGGCIVDNGPNILDSLRSILGPMDMRECRVRRVNGVDMQAQAHMLTRAGIAVTAHLDWQYGHGEKKDISIHLRDGETRHVDFLEGFPKFKESLWHEYEGVMQDFIDHIASGRSNAEEGCDSVCMVQDAYAKEVAL